MEQTKLALCRPQTEHIKKIGISIAVDAKGIPYLTTSDGKALIGIKSFDIHVGHDSALVIKINEMYASQTEL